MRKFIVALGVIALSVLSALTVLFAPSASAADDGSLAYAVKPTDNEVGAGRPNFGYLAKPGGTLRDAIDVVNHSDEPLAVGIYAADAFTPGPGLIDLLPKDEESVDVGSWITLDSSSITVPPQGSVSVPFSLTVPADATPGDHSGGIVTSMVTQDGAIGVDHRIGTRVYIRVDGELKPQLEVSKVQLAFDAGFNPFSGGTATVRYTVTNSGNVRLDAHRSIKLSGLLGVASKTSKADDIGELLPGNSVSFTQRVDDVWSTGLLKATVTLSPFASEDAPDVAVRPISASTTKWVLAKGHLVALPVLIAVVGGAVWWRIRRKRAIAAAIDKAVADALESADVTKSEGSGQS